MNPLKKKNGCFDRELVFLCIIACVYGVSYALLLFSIA